MMVHLRRIASTRHPLLLGGGVSGALVAAAIAAFVSITALGSSSDLPGGVPSLSPVRSGTMTLPSFSPPARRAGAATTAQPAPLALHVPTAGVAPPPAAAPSIPVLVASATRTAVGLAAHAADQA